MVSIISVVGGILIVQSIPSSLGSAHLLYIPQIHAFESLLKPCFGQAASQGIS